MGEVDENGEIAILSDQASYRDRAHMRVVYEFSKYGEYVSDLPPSNVSD